MYGMHIILYAYSKNRNKEEKKKKKKKKNTENKLWWNFSLNINPLLFTKCLHIIHQISHIKNIILQQN